jgi:hypothetical protein
MIEIDEMWLTIMRLRTQFPGLAAKKRQRIVELVLDADAAAGHVGLAELALTFHEPGHA